MKLIKIFKTKMKIFSVFEHRLLRLTYWYIRRSEALELSQNETDFFSRFTKSKGIMPVKRITDGERKREHAKGETRKKNTILEDRRWGLKMVAGKLKTRSLFHSRGVRKKKSTKYNLRLLPAIFKNKKMGSSLGSL